MPRPAGTPCRPFRFRSASRSGAADMLNAMPTGYEHLSEDELWDSLSCHELDADGDRADAGVARVLPDLH